MSEDRSYDVIVIGGGPAGSAAAGFLAKDGYKVALIEKGKHPRYQVGESLIPHFWKFADALGVTQKIEQEGFIAKGGATHYWEGTFRQFRFGDFGHERPPLHVERDRFDEILFRHAASLGAETFEDTLVTNAEPSADGGVVTVRFKDSAVDTTFRCKVIIDASGQGGLLARKMKSRELDGDFRYMGIWGYFKTSRFAAYGGTVHEESERHVHPPTTFITNIGQNRGWGWNIMLRGTTSVGILVSNAQVKDEKKELERYFLETVKAAPYFGDLVEVSDYEEGSLHMRRDYSYRSTTFSGPGFFLIGDAAAFSDPVFSHGVQFGFYSALQAAAGARTAMDGDPARAAKSYDYRLRQYYEFSRSLALPNYDPNVRIAESVCGMLRMMPKRELELMYVASSLTDRSSNFLRMAEEAGLTASPEGLHILPQLRWLDGRPFETSAGMAAAE
jgi:flavin-dependent dehydrogenase